MKNSLHAVVWVLVGMVLMGAIVWFTMPSLMLLKYRSGYDYEKTVAMLRDAVKEKPGWKVLTVNDYRSATAEFAAIDRVGSIAVCNPRYASKILAEDKSRGVVAMMPLEIGVYEDSKGQVYVSQMNLSLMGMMFGGTIAEVMGKAGNDISGAIETVVAK